MLALAAESTFVEITLLLALAAGVGGVGLLLRQPLIVAFIAVGMLAGPSALDLIHSHEKIDLLSELGIAVLLFLVGIKLDLKLIRSIGGVSLLTGLGQVFFTSSIGFLIGLGLGLSTLDSIYVAVALTFSSTIIIVKLLSDKRELDSLHGQIALGFLIVQDLVVVFAMITLAAVGIGGEGGHGKGGSWGQLLLSGGGLVVLVGVFIKYIANPLTRRLAKEPELLLIYALAQAALFAAIGEQVGLGKEVGGLLAGVALASTPYRESISARLAPLRDFLLLFFFIALGTSLDLNTLQANMGAALVLSLFVLLGNPLIVLVLMVWMGYRKRTGFLAGLTVAQISEFSLIFVAMGISIGHVSPSMLGLVTLVGIVTIATSTYMITFSHQLYTFAEPYLRWLDREYAKREDALDSTAFVQPQVLIMGLGRSGTILARNLAERGIPLIALDFSPTVVRQRQEEGVKARFGDATDPEFLIELGLQHIEWIVVAVPNYAAGTAYEDHLRTIIQATRAAGFNGRFAAIAHSETDAQRMSADGIDLIFEPHRLAGDKAAETLAGILAQSAEVEEAAYEAI